MFKAEFLRAIELDQNPNVPASTFHTEDLMEKLKLLNFERLVLKDIKMKPIGRYYFRRALNPGEQFFMFTTLCAWLSRLLGKSFDQPQEFDDPNTTIARIIQVLKEMDIPTDFPSNKLLQGGGPICVFILDCLATQTIKLSQVQLQRPIPPQEDETPPEPIENDNEVILEKVEEEQNAQASDDSDQEEKSMMMHFNNGTTSAKHTAVPSSGLHDYKVDNLSDSENWRLELERVLPQLKIVVKSDPRDWRAHLEQMRSLKDSIATSVDDTKRDLKKLHDDIGFVMEKIDSREKHLNNDLQNLINDYKKISGDLSLVNNLIRENDSVKTDTDRELIKLTQELENVKTLMEVRGNSMTDGSPLINIKKAIVKIREEITNMDLQIAVIEHTHNHELIKQCVQYTEMDPLAAVVGGN